LIPKSFMETKNIGLRNIPIADTKISFIDGDKGKLIYRGYDILDLTKNSTFEETCFLLLHDKLPTKNEYDDFKTELVNARIGARTALIDFFGNSSRCLNIHRLPSEYPRYRSAGFSFIFSRASSVSNGLDG